VSSSHFNAAAAIVMVTSHGFDAASRPLVKAGPVPLLP
jgi:hypothetical protein